MGLAYVDLGQYGYVIEPRYYFYGWARSSRILARESLAKALAKAHTNLLKTHARHNFKIWDGSRSRNTQLAMIDSFRRRFRAAHPEWSARRSEEEIRKFAAPPYWRPKRLDSHRTGGAVDLTIVGPDGHELFMGTDHDDLTVRAALDHFEAHRPQTPAEELARRNRRLLIRVMQGAGFKGYDAEWWHWTVDW